MLTAVLERFEHVRRVRGGWLASCPAHADHTPSLSVGDGERGGVVVHCFAGCQTVDVLAAVGLTMRDLAGDAVVDAPRRLRPVRLRPVPTHSDQAQLEVQVAEAADRLAGASADHPAVRYAVDQFGLATADAHRLRLGYLVAGGVRRLVVPFRDPRGGVLGWQARALDADVEPRWLSPRSPSQGEWSRWGWFRGNDLDAPVMVTEGPGDALTAVAAGFHAIAIRGAANANGPATQRSVASLAGRRQIILAGDGDEAGRRFNRTFATALREAGAWVTIAQLPDGLDLTDYQRQDPAACAAWLQELRS